MAVVLPCWPAGWELPTRREQRASCFFIEDRDVKPYQLDRLLRQMILAGKFEGVAGIVFGEMLDCVATGQKPELLDEVILRVLDWFEGPIAIGLRSGHVFAR